jgi:hypothetical protein
MQSGPRTQESADSTGRSQAAGHSEPSVGGEPAMSWTQPAHSSAGQAQLFEPPAAATGAPPVLPVPATVGPAMEHPEPEAPKKVVWSSSSMPANWHGDGRRDE